MTNLNPIQKTVLEEISNQKKPTTKSIYQTKGIESNYNSKKACRNLINRLRNDDNLIEVVEKSGKSNVYGLTEKGENALQKIKERRKKDVKDVEFYDGSNAEEVFRQLFEGMLSDELVKAKKGLPVELDLQWLSKNDFDLEEDLRGNYEEVMDACKSVLESYPDVGNDPEVRLKNPFKEDLIEIKDIEPNKHNNNIVVIDGVIETISKPKASLERAVFECQNCEKKYTKEQDSNKLKSPFKCECGSKKFEPIEKIHEKVFVGKIKDKPSKKERKAIRFVIKGDLLNNEDLADYTGKTIKAIGKIELNKENQSSEYLDPVLYINNIEFSQERWEDLEITDDDEERIQQFRDSQDSFDGLVDSLVRSIDYEGTANLELVKEGILCFLLGKEQDPDDSNLHVLVFGEPGTGKSQLANYLDKNFPKTIKSLGTGSTGVGLTASVKKDEMTKEWVAEAGALPQAHRGYHITDEIDKASSEDLVKMNEALSDNTISLNKASINTTIQADVSELAFGNPEGKRLDPYKEALTQLPIEEDDLLNRFDLKILVKPNDSKEHQKEVLDRILTDKSGQNQEDNEILELDLLRKYIFKAQKLDPELTENVKEKLKEIYFKFKELESKKRENGEYSRDHSLIDYRRFESLIKLSKAYARMDLSPIVEEKHLKRSNKFFRRTLERMDVIPGKDSLDKINHNPKSDIRKVKELVPAESEIKKDKLIEEVSKEYNIDEKKIVEIITHLRNEGELWEPSKDFIKRV